ncbi:arginine repressor [bacterium]|nr:arginine repressor [bacterium]
MSEAAARRDAIRRLIAEHALGTQAELVERLAEAGINATQSSVSRDIAHLGLVKAGGRYVIPAASDDTPPPVRILEAAPADAIAVVKVEPGTAPALGLHLDRSDWPEIVGTVAGDDTVIVACRSKQARNAVLARLSRS